MKDTPSDSGKTEVLGGKTQWTHPAVLAAACALIIGVFGWSTESGLLESACSRAEESYYNLLVQGFRAGQLNLKREAPPGLAHLADPYDPIANSDYRLSDSYPLHDLSYYRGKLYLYFGVTPALLLFWPYTVLTGDYLLHKDAVVFFCAVGFLVSVGLLRALWQRYFAEVGFGVVVAGTVALGLATFTPVILPRSNVYEVPISCGYALTMLALAGIWRALHEPWRRGWWLAAASLVYGLALGARPSFLLGAVILLVPVVQAWREGRRIGAPLMAATGPLVLVGLGLMVYNALRFGNPLEFGLHYQLSGSRADTQQHFSLRYLWFNFWVFFLAPARWSSCFPFVHDIAVPSLPAGYIEAEHPFGVLTNIPLVWLAVAVPLAWRSRSAEVRSILGGYAAVVALLFGICALTICLHNSACVRYEGEFAHPLVLLAVIGILGLERALASRPVWRRAARWGWGLLLAFSVVFNLLASVDRHAEAHSELGIVLFHKGQLDEAITEFHRALEIRPNDVIAHGELGIALSRKGQLDEAIAQLTEVVRLLPDDANAHADLGMALGQQGRSREASACYRQALRLKPDLAEALNNLAWILATDEATSNRNGAEAVRLAERACRSTHYENPIFVGTLGAAYAEAGRFDEAAAMAEKAQKLWLSRGEPNPAETNKNLIHLYNAHQAYHETRKGKGVRKGVHPDNLQ
jgi:Flp pilus assembly protein TadD